MHTLHPGKDSSAGTYPEGLGCLLDNSAPAFDKARKNKDHWASKAKVQKAINNAFARSATTILKMTSDARSETPSLV